MTVEYNVVVTAGESANGLEAQILVNPSSY
jgi:hypothetical protein